MGALRSFHDVRGLGCRCDPRRRVERFRPARHHSHRRAHGQGGLRPGAANPDLARRAGGVGGVHRLRHGHLGRWLCLVLLGLPPLPACSGQSAHHPWVADDQSHQHRGTTVEGSRARGTPAAACRSCRTPERHHHRSEVHGGGRRRQLDAVAPSPPHCGLARRCADPGRLRSVGGLTHPPWPGRTAPPLRSCVAVGFRGCRRSRCGNLVWCSAMAGRTRPGHDSGRGPARAGPLPLTGPCHRRQLSGHPGRLARSPA